MKLHKILKLPGLKQSAPLQKAQEGLNNVKTWCERAESLNEQLNTISPKLNELLKSVDLVCKISIDALFCRMNGKVDLQEKVMFQPTRKLNDVKSSLDSCVDSLPDFVKELEKVPKENKNIFDKNEKDVNDVERLLSSVTIRDLSTVEMQDSNLVTGPGYGVTVRRPLGSLIEDTKIPEAVEKRLQELNTLRINFSLLAINFKQNGTGV